jgi:hypothetical protein
MDIPTSPITPETETLLQQLGGPVTLAGQQGEYVVMRSDVYDAMPGIVADDESETLASVRRGLADMASGRVRDLDDVFADLDSDQ